MAWKVYGFMEGGLAGNNQFGPLPLKRWIRDIPHKRHKVRHKVTPAHVKPAGLNDSTDERHAESYARWLAQRDGIDIAHGLTCRVEWSGIYSATKTRNVRHWNGTKAQAAYLKRVRAVAWGRKHERYNERKDGKRGAWTHNEFVAEVTIELPNWDWEPAEPVLEINEDYFRDLLAIESLEIAA